MSNLKSKVKSITNQFLHKFGVKVVTKREYVVIDIYETLKRNKNFIDILPFALEILSRSVDPIKFVQVGANDGMRDDPFREYIDKYGLKGIMVEPQINAFKKLNAMYSSNTKIICENVAIASSEEPINIFYFDSAHEGDLQLDVFASTDKEYVLKCKKERGIQANIQEKKFPTMTIESLLLKNNWDSFEVLIIDTEGYDYEILKSINFEFLTPLLIVYEHINLSPKDRLHAVEMLTEKDYFLLPGWVDTTALHKGFFKFLT